MPLAVSIVTASLNNKATIESSFQSLQSQTLQAEHIVIDGGSTDGTLDVIEKYSDRISCIVSEPDRGLYDALNKGIERATGDVIGILHADDYFADTRVVEDVVGALEKSGADAAYGDLEYVDAFNDQKIKRRWVAGNCAVSKVYNGWIPPHPTFFVRRTCYEDYGNFRLDLGTSADYELMLRFVLIQRIKLEYLPRVLVRMRSGGVSNASVLARIRANRMDRRAWEVNEVRPRPWTLLSKPLRKLGQWRFSI